MIKEMYLGMATYFNNLEEVKRYYSLEDNKEIESLEDVQKYLEYDYEGMEYPILVEI